MRTGRVRTDPVAVVDDGEHRTAAGGDRVDGQHRGAERDAGDLVVPVAFEAAGVVRDGGRGTAPVQAAVFGDARPGAQPRRGDDPGRRAGQHGVLAPQVGGLGQPAVRGHHQQSDAGQFGRQPRQVGVDDRGQIGVDHGGRRPAAPPAASGRRPRSRTPARSRPRGRPGPRRTRAPGAGGRAGTPPPATARRRPGGGQVRPQPLEVRGAQHGAVVSDPLGVSQDGLLQWRGPDEGAGEDPRAVLVADRRQVGEPVGDQQGGARTAAFQQGVGGHGRAQPDRADPVGGHRRVGRRPEQFADPGQGGVGVAAWVLRQQLAGVPPAGSGERPTTSVNVPPRSTQNSQRSDDSAPVAKFRPNHPASLRSFPVVT